MPRNMKKDKYQLVVIVGDISPKEGNVVFKLWKHLDKQIATGNSFKCIQCGKWFARKSGNQGYRYNGPGGHMKTNAVNLHL